MAFRMFYEQKYIRPNVNSREMLRKFAYIFFSLPPLHFTVNSFMFDDALCILSSNDNYSQDASFLACKLSPCEESPHFHMTFSSKAFVV